MYYKLVFQRHDGSRVTAEVPGGGTRPSEYLFELRQTSARYAIRRNLATPRRKQPHDTNKHPSNHRNLALLEEPDWAAWADSTRFETTARLLHGYATAEVDAFHEAIRDAFLGVRPPPLTWGEAHGKRFSTQRRGYDVEQVDAFLDQAELRLAARESRAAAGRWRIKITIVYQRRH
jgi:DivIVA domain-containing protein